MEDQNQGGNAPDASNASDPLTQFKAEFSRKTDGLKNEVAELKAATSVLVEALNRTTKPAAAKSEDVSLTDLMYSDPERYAQVLEERAESRIMGRLSKQQEAQARTQSVLNELASEFPEINDMHSPLTKKAVELYGALPENERNSPLSYKLAVKEAAAELGVKPRSKRTDEDFVGGGSAQGSSGSRRPKAEKLDPSTRRWADVLGVEVTPEVEARLIERSKRKWSTYQKPLPVKSKKGTK